MKPRDRVKVMVSVSAPKSANHASTYDLLSDLLAKLGDLEETHNVGIAGSGNTRLDLSVDWET